MKKIIVSLVMMCLLFSVVGSPAFASESNVNKAIELIDKTNREIDKKIEKAVEKADTLQAGFLQEVRVIEEGKELVKLENEKNKVSLELEKAVQADKNYDKKIKGLEEKKEKLEARMLEERAKINERLSALQADMEDLTVTLLTTEGKEKKKLQDKLDKLEAKFSKKDDMYDERIKKYTLELEKVIATVYDETFEMSAKTIAKAAELGVEAECSWKLVRFADQWVWIDPIKVVGWGKV